MRRECSAHLAGFARLPRRSSSKGGIWSRAACRTLAFESSGGFASLSCRKESAMVQMHNVTVSLAQAEERAPQLESAEGNEPPVYAPPYEQVPTVRLPTKEDIAKSLKEQRAREVGSAQQESAIAAAAATSGSGAVNANAFASLGEPAIALSLRFRPDPPPITSSQINDPLAAVALNPQPLPPRALARASDVGDPLLGLKP